MLWNRNSPSFIVCAPCSRTLLSFGLEDGTEKPNHRNSVAPQSSTRQFVTGLRWNIGRPIEHLPPLARSSLGSGFQVGIGQNGR